MGEKHVQHLFDHNPPEDERWVSELFRNRAKELHWGLEQLRSNEAFPKVFAVHGKTRCGKSHLVRYLLLKVKEEKLPYVVFSVNANSKGSAGAVLEDIFFQLKADIENLDEAAVPEGVMGVYEAALPYLFRMGQLLLGEVTEVALTETKTKLESLGLGVGLLPPPFKFIAEGKVEYKVGAEERWSLNAPSEPQLVELLRYQADLVAMLHPGKRVLLFVDDLDLLDRAGARDTEKADALLNYLKPLAEPISTTLVATTRPAYFNGREKDFKDFMEVVLMDPTSVHEIYKRHVELFNDGEEVFSEEALAWLENGSRGRVGIFLHRCYRIWRYFYGDRATPYEKADIKDYLRVQIDELKGDPDHAIIYGQVEAAVREQRQDLRIEGDLGVTGVLYDMLEPIHYRAGTYAITPLFAEVIAELPGVAPRDEDSGKGEE